MTLVLLPGLMCDARLFGPQLGAFPDAIVITSTTKDTMTAMAEEALSLAPETFALAGLSMGGIIAMEIMRLAPNRVSHLALLDTNHRAETDAMKTSRLAQIKAVRAGTLSTVMREQLIPQYLTDGPQCTWIFDVCLKMGQDLGSDAFVNQSQALMDRRDQSDTLKTIRCPTLIMCGAQDRLCPVSRHQEMAHILPEATLEIIEQAGHLPTLEAPTEATAALRRWLEAS